MDIYGDRCSYTRMLEWDNCRCVRCIIVAFCFAIFTHDFTLLDLYFTLCELCYALLGLLDPCFDLRDLCCVLCSKHLFSTKICGNCFFFGTWTLIGQGILKCAAQTIVK